MIYNFGCTANFKEGEILENKVNKVLRELKEQGFDEIKNLNLTIVNTCAVKGPTENKILRLIEDLAKKGNVVLVSGCLALAYPEKIKRLKEKYKNIVAIGENFLNEEELKKVILNNAINILTNKNFKDEKNRLVLTGKEREIIEINRGCLGNCTYCATKLAIPGFYSYKSDDILNLIKEAYKKGTKEIFLTSQDTGAYGLDNKENILTLVKKINEWWKDAEKKDLFIRIGMMNPNFVGKIMDELLEEMEKGPFYRFIHLPLQSGSDFILKKMNRGYTLKDWLKIAKKVKEKGFTLATDIIVAYPGESKEDFEKTLEVFDLVDIDVVNISKFWPRPKTKAFEEWKKSKIDERVAKERAKVLKEKFEKRLKEINAKYLEKNKKKPVKVLFNEYDKKYQSLKGKDLYYKQVVVKIDENKAKNLLWKTKEVYLKDFSFNTFLAELIS